MNMKTLFFIVFSGSIAWTAVLTLLNDYSANQVPVALFRVVRHILNIIF